MPIKGLKWRLWIEGWVYCFILFPLETPRRFFKPWYREGRAPRTPLPKRHRSSSWILSWSQLLDWHGFTTVFLSTACLKFMIVRLDLLITLFNLCLAHSSLHDFCHWLQRMREISGVVLVVMVVVVVVAAGAAASLRTVHTVLIVQFYLFLLVWKFVWCILILILFSCCLFFLALSFCICDICVVLCSYPLVVCLSCVFFLSVCVCQHLLVGFVLSHTFEHYRILQGAWNSLTKMKHNFQREMMDTFDESIRLGCTNGRVPCFIHQYISIWRKGSSATF